MDQTEEWIPKKKDDDDKDKKDDDQKKKYSEMVETLIEEYGYNESSAEEILTYASNNLWRDS